MWWENPPLHWKNAKLAIWRVRQEPRGSGYPRIMMFGGEETSAVSKWFPMQLILWAPLHVPGFVHENGRLYSNKETQTYGDRIVRQGRQAREDRGQIFEVETDWNVVKAHGGTTPPCDVDGTLSPCQATVRNLSGANSGQQ